MLGLLGRGVMCVRGRGVGLVGARVLGGELIPFDGVLHRRDGTLPQVGLGVSQRRFGVVEFDAGGLGAEGFVLFLGGPVGLDGFGVLDDLLRDAVVGDPAQKVLGGDVVHRRTRGATVLPVVAGSATGATTIHLVVHPLGVRRPTADFHVDAAEIDHLLRWCRVGPAASVLVGDIDGALVPEFLDLLPDQGLGGGIATAVLGIEFRVDHLELQLESLAVFFLRRCAEQVDQSDPPGIRIAPDFAVVHAHHPLRAAGLLPVDHMRVPHDVTGQLREFRMRVLVEFRRFHDPLRGIEGRKLRHRPDAVQVVGDALDALHRPGQTGRIEQQFAADQLLIRHAQRMFLIRPDRQPFLDVDELTDVLPAHLGRLRPVPHRLVVGFVSEDADLRALAFVRPGDVVRALLQPPAGVGGIGEQLQLRVGDRSTRHLLQLGDRRRGRFRGPHSPGVLRPLEIRCRQTVFALCDRQPIPDPLQFGDHLGCGLLRRPRG
ncbi:hypothetical protein [Nocardia niwae]|uniref:hypothetical protein n=1 Tax=Nocardia niwae TaxID=626084 RepID=UPI0014721CA0|nr:hypothetical protein [Nocardia niwae]